MIIKLSPLKTEGDPESIIRYLLESHEENEKTVLIQGSRERIKEDYRISFNASCNDGLLHVKLSPDPKYAMTEDKWKRCLEAICSEFGIDHAEATIVQHTKKERTHQHILLPAFDIAANKKIHLFLYKTRCQKIAKILEKEFNHEFTPLGYYSREVSVMLKNEGYTYLAEKVLEMSPSDSVSFNFTDIEIAKRFGYDLSVLKEQFLNAMSLSNDKDSFNRELKKIGFKIENKATSKGVERFVFTPIDNPDLNINARRAIGMRKGMLTAFLNGEEIHS